MRLLSNLHVKGKPAVLPDRAICRQSYYFIYRPRMYRSEGIASGILNFGIRCEYLYASAALPQAKQPPLFIGTQSRLVRCREEKHLKHLWREKVSMLAETKRRFPGHRVRNVHILQTELCRQMPDEYVDLCLLPPRRFVDVKQLSVRHRLWTCH